MKTNNINRRKFMSLGATTTGVWLLANPISKAIAGACGLTPPQTSGPFYPGQSQFSQDNDLTTVNGQRALGNVITIKGVIQDQDCKGIAHASVEIWQACASGRYQNPNDTNPAPLDPNFKYWGETYTNQKGEYLFKTIIPGAYPADTNWTRPAHIHFKVAKLGYSDLVTQMYFKGDKYNDADRILKAIPASLRSSVIVDFKDDPMFGTLTGNFNITLKAIT